MRNLIASLLLLAVSYTASAQKTRNDITPPVVLSVNRQLPTTLSTNASSITFRVTFSEKVTGVDVTDFTLNLSGVTGTIVAIVKVGSTGTLYDVNLNPVRGNGTVSLSLLASTAVIKDAAGNLMRSDYTGGQSYTIDQAPPVVSGIRRSSPEGPSTNASAVTFRVTFSEKVSGVDYTDFTALAVSGTVQGAIAQSSVTATDGTGAAYDVTVGALSGSGALRLDLKASGTGIADAVANSIQGGYTGGETYLIDRVAPTLSFVSIFSSNSNTAIASTGDVVTLSFTASEAVTGVAVTMATHPVDAVPGSSNSFTASYTMTSNDAAGVVPFTIRFSDNAGNTGTTVMATTDGSSVTFELSTPPADLISPTVVSITRYSPTTEATDASSVVYKVTFSESVTGVDAADFTVSVVSGALSATISAVTAAGTDGTGYYITISAIDGSGTLRLDVKDNGTGIADGANNLLAGAYTDGERYSISQPPADQVSPSVVSISRQNPTTQTTTSTQLTYRVTFSEAVSGVDAADFTATRVSGAVSGTVGSVTAISGTGNTAYDVAVSASGTGDLRLDVNSTGTGITDASGNVISGGYTAGESYTVQAPPPSEGPTFIPFKSAWKYLDNGSDAGTAWRSPFFSDAGWKSGVGELGYGDGDETTLVNYGPNASAKYITTYFRKSISITNPEQYASYNISIIRDDGAVVYLNGVEVHRSNMPAGAITYTTLASPAGAYNDGKPPVVFNLPASAFRAGANIIAVEVHQNYANSTDLSFDLQLEGSSIVLPPPPTTPTLTRGPYLQMVGPSAATFRWRTDIATDSKIEAGTNLGSYTLSATNSTTTTEHEVRITGLAANTQYFYRIGSSSQVLQEGSANYFTTAPPAHTTQKIRVAAFGDCGVAGSVQQNVLNSYLSYVGTAPASVLLLLGDNAYTNGTDAEYQSQFFAPYSNTILKNHALFSTPGNHDYYSSAQTSRSGAYYNNFTLPTAGECGGTASGTEAYYSFNWGPIHFLSLDSYGQEGDLTRLYDTLGPQVTWVKQDLEANNSRWTVVYFHHPPYTMGSHNADTEGELIRIRQNFVRILERYGVDLVLCGHSHNYERSYLLRGYYGTEPTFNMSTHTVTSSSGQYNGSINSCPFSIPAGKVNHGTVYVVSGSAARNNATVQAGFPHEALPYATRAGGMFLLEVEDNRLDGKMITETGEVFDGFTIMKDVGKTSSLPLSIGQPVTLTASWVGTYQWSTGATTRSITVTPSTEVNYSVTDDNKCLRDEFTIAVPVTLKTVRESEDLAVAEKGDIAVFPTYVQRGKPLTLCARSDEVVVEAIVADAVGRLHSTFRFKGTASLQTRQLPPGNYFLILKTRDKARKFRFLVTD